MNVSLGFRFDQTMRGRFHLLSNPVEEGHALLSLELSAPRLASFLLDRVVVAKGVLDLERFATRVPIEGAVLLRPFDDQRLRYDLRFVANDGVPYALQGETDVLVIDWVETLATLEASLFKDASTEVGRVRLRFDFRNDWGEVLRSLRPTLSVGFDG